MNKFKITVTLEEIGRAGGLLNGVERLTEAFGFVLRAEGEGEAVHRAMALLDVRLDELERAKEQDDDPAYKVGQIQRALLRQRGVGNLETLRIIQDIVWPDRSSAVDVSDLPIPDPEPEENTPEDQEQEEGEH